MIIFRSWTPPPDDRGYRSAHSSFTATWTDTKSLLVSEARQLAFDPKNPPPVVIEVAVKPGAIRADGFLRADAKVHDDRVVVYIDSVYGPLRYESGNYINGGRWNLPGWQANIRAVALSLKALRDVNRWGIAGSGEQYRGWSALPAGGSTTSHADAVELLRSWCDATIADDDWEAMFRRAAKKHHPDVGGDPDMFRQLVIARDLLVGSA